MWKKGCPPPNPKGRPRTGTALAERIRERVDVDELIQIASDIARGTPMVQIVDSQTGMPRAVVAHSRRLDRDITTEARPDPITSVKLSEHERIHGIVYPSTSERVQALTWIRDSGGMKPPAQMEMTVARGQDQDVDFTRLSPEQLDQYVALCDLMAGSEEGQKVLAEASGSGEDEDEDQDE
jgi:hypothetical protein